MGGGELGEICLVFIFSHSFSYCSSTPTTYYSLNVSVAYVCHLGICTLCVFVYSWSRNKFHHRTGPGWNPSEIWPTFHQNSLMNRSSSHQMISTTHCILLLLFYIRHCFIFHQRYSTRLKMYMEILAQLSP